jgi:hypothetical protein
MAADDILFQALEVVDATADCGFAEHLRGFLEGSCGDEAVGAQSCAGDTAA